MIPLFTAVIAASAIGLSSVKPPSIDMFEYNHVIQITALSMQQVKKCKTEDTDLELLTLHIETLTEYEKHLVDSEERLEISKILSSLIKEINQRETFSSRYCQHKLSEIQSISRAMAMSLGGKHQSKVCDTDFEKRLSIYESSFKKNLISKSEYLELISDVIEMGKADGKACSLENQTKLDQAQKVVETIFQMVGGL